MAKQRKRRDDDTAALFVRLPLEEAEKLIHGVDFQPSALAAARDADAVVLVTEWPEFGDIDLEELRGAMSGTLIVDGRNYLDPVAVRAAGLAYEGIGRPGGV